MITRRGFGQLAFGITALATAGLGKVAEALTAKKKDGLASPGRRPGWNLKHRHLIANIVDSVDREIDGFRFELIGERTWRGVRDRVYRALLDYCSRGYIRDFWVKCDAEINPPSRIDANELVVDWAFLVESAQPRPGGPDPYNWFQVRSVIGPEAYGVENQVIGAGSGTAAWVALFCGASSRWQLCCTKHVPAPENSHLSTKEGIRIRYGYPTRADNA
jgi:hypothetical protein